MSTPQSTIHVCAGVRLSNDYKHTIWFENESKQKEYFAGKVKYTFSAYTYLRKNWSIDVQAPFVMAQSWNYLFFKNTPNQNPVTSPGANTYYYFITNVHYVSDSVTRLDIELDVMQTFMFKYNLLPCFIDREHSATDNIGDNLIDEGLEFGDYIDERVVDVNLGDLCVLVLTTYHPGIDDDVLATRMDGVFGGATVLAVDMVNWQGLGVALKSMDSAGKSDCIISMWMYPKALVELADGEEWGATVFHQVKASKIFATSINKTGIVDDMLTKHGLKNKKLCTFPYTFLYATNNSGGACNFKFERFKEGNYFNFQVVGSLSPEGATKLVPYTYNDVTFNFDEGLIGGNYPTCAWNQDVYKLWLAQNQNQQNLAMVTDGLTVAGGLVATGIGVATMNGAMALGGLGATMHGAESIASILAQRKDKAIQPPQARGNYSASVNVKANKQTFSIHVKQITKEFALMLDDYFSMYGYKTNKVKVPNRNVRENWTYTKTIDCHVAGDLCAEDIRKIQSIYDAGITFWVNGDKIGEYSLSNNCK